MNVVKYECLERVYVTVSVFSCIICHFFNCGGQSRDSVLTV